MNRAYTVDQLYVLWTYDNGEKKMLGTIDGTQATEISLDTLIFKMKEYATSIVQEGIGISRQDENTFVISYYNPEGDNSSATLKIYDGSNLLFSNTFDENANNFAVLFNTSTLTITNDLLKAELTITRNDGTSTTLITYFDSQGNVGALDPVVAFMFALFLFVFGLTIVSFRFALGWFGIIITAVALLITTMAVPTWYIVFLQVMLVISLLYILLVYKGDTGKLI
jgi:hypothetical protein